MPAPVIAAGITAGVGMLGNRKTAAEKAMEGTARQQGVMANQISSMARQQHTMAGPAMQKAMQHYMQLAGGNRAAIQSALAPDMNNMMQSYKGAEIGMTSRMAPGPQRDAAIAALYQQKAGQMGMMPFHAKQNAFGQLGDMGQNLMQLGNQAYGTAGGILGGQAQTQSQLAQLAGQRQAQWGSLGEAVGNIFYPWLTGKFGGAPGTFQMPKGPSNRDILGPRP